jgi:fumarate hydratase class II
LVGSPVWRRSRNGFGVGIGFADSGGYDNASAIAHKANDEGTTLREAALASGYVSAEDFDRIVVPSSMVGR